jgi:hypothetical protein
LALYRLSLAFFLYAWYYSMASLIHCFGSKPVNGQNYTDPAVSTLSHPKHHTEIQPDPRSIATSTAKSSLAAEQSRLAGSGRH